MTKQIFSKAMRWIDEHGLEPRFSLLDMSLIFLAITLLDFIWSQYLMRVAIDLQNFTNFCQYLGISIQ